MIHLRIACFATSNAEFRNVLDFYAYCGNKVLEPHGMALRHRYGEGPVIPDTVTWNGYVASHDGTADRVAALCRQLWPGAKGIPVILCNRGEGTDAVSKKQYPYGWTMLAGDTDPNGRMCRIPFICINANKINPDGTVLVHELIHAATNLGNEGHDSDPASVFFSGYRNPDGQESDVERPRYLRKEHADSLRAASFAERS